MNVHKFLMNINLKLSLIIFVKSWVFSFLKTRFNGNKLYRGRQTLQYLYYIKTIMICKLN